VFEPLFPLGNPPALMIWLMYVQILSIAIYFEKLKHDLFDGYISIQHQYGFVQINSEKIENMSVFIYIPHRFCKASSFVLSQ
jgi:hypothetical protein